MRLITTHINADFDGLASMIAARKLYPDAVIAFPGSQQRNVRDFISQNLLYSYDFAREKDIDTSKVTELILVDTRIAARIGKFAKCLENNNLIIRIFDHHLQSNRILRSTARRRQFSLSEFTRIQALSPISPPPRRT